MAISTDSAPTVAIFVLPETGIVAVTSHGPRKRVTVLVTRCLLFVAILNACHRDCAPRSLCTVRKLKADAARAKVLLPSGDVQRQIAASELRRHSQNCRYFVPRCFLHIYRCRDTRASWNDLLAATSRGDLLSECMVSLNDAQQRYNSRSESESPGNLIHCDLLAGVKVLRR